jgi:transposase InsO family protein
MDIACQRRLHGILRITTIRRDFLDQALFCNPIDLERKLELFRDYYNHSRTHASLDGNAPTEISGDRVAQPAPLKSYTWEKHCGGLFQLPVAA